MVLLRPSPQRFDVFLVRRHYAIAFMGALRGLPLAEGKARGRELLEGHGIGHAIDRQIRQLSKGMAQTVQLLGTLVHRPKLVVLDEPNASLDAAGEDALIGVMSSRAG